MKNKDELVSFSSQVVCYTSAAEALDMIAQTGMVSVVRLFAILVLPKHLI